MGVVVGQEEKPTPSRCDWHVSIRLLGPYILAHGGLTLGTPSGLAGKQSWGKVRERGRSEEVVGQIGLPVIQNRPQESWNEVNSMPTHMLDFGVICGLIWQNWRTGNAAGQLNRHRTLSFFFLTCWESLLWLFWFLLCPPRENKNPGYDDRLPLLHSLDTHTYGINSN